MPTTPNETRALIADLNSRLEHLVAAARAEGRASALDAIRSLVGGAGLPVKRGPGRPPKLVASAGSAATPKKQRRNSWSGLSAEQRLARVNAIRRGKGLPPKSA